MSCENVFRDITEIYNRLFTHRAALHGLTNNFVKEFEERRGEHEVLALSRTLELVTDNKNRAMPAIHELLDSQLEQFDKSVGKTRQLCERILEDAKKEKGDWLQSERECREKEWELFMSAQVAHSNRVDEEFQHKVDTLRSHYADLESKLKEGRTGVL